MSAGAGWIRERPLPYGRGSVWGVPEGWELGGAVPLLFLDFFFGAGLFCCCRSGLLVPGVRCGTFWLCSALPVPGDAGLGAWWVLISGLFSPELLFGTSCFSCDELLWSGLVCWATATPGVHARVAPRAAVIKWFMNLGRFIALLEWTTAGRNQFLRRTVRQSPMRKYRNCNVVRHYFWP